MKIRVDVPFTDKYTDVSYSVGDVLEFDDERANELLTDVRNLVTKAEEAEENGVVEPVTQKPPKRGRKGK